MKSKMTDLRRRVVALAMLLVAAGVWNTSEVQAQEPADEQTQDAAGDLRYSLSYVARFTPATNDAFAMGLGVAPGLRVGVEGLFLEELGLGFVVHGGTRQATPFDRTMELRWDRVGFMAEADYGMRFLDERLRPALRVGLGYMHHELLMYTGGTSGEGWRNQYEGHAGSLAFTAQAVLDLTLVRSRSEKWAFAMYGSWGLAGHTRANFDEMNPIYEEGDRVVRAPIDAGSASALRFGGEVGFTLVWRP